MDEVGKQGKNRDHEPGFAAKVGRKDHTRQAPDSRNASTKAHPQQQPIVSDENSKKKTEDHKAEKPEGLQMLSEELHKRLEEAEALAKKWKERCYREAASKENLQKSMAKDVADAANYANFKIASDIILLRDDVERLIKEASKLPKCAKACKDVVADGDNSGVVDLLLQLTNTASAVDEAAVINARNMEKLFLNHGITKISPLGEQFDPHYHQSIRQIEAPDVKAGAVVEVLQDGYMLKDRVIRPALVVIAAHKQGA